MLHPSFCLDVSYQLPPKWVQNVQGRKIMGRMSAPYIDSGTVTLIIIIIIYPLNARVIGHHRWFHNQFPPFSPVLHCLLGLGNLPACPFPDVVFPPLSPSALSSSPFHCALQDGFGQTWWTGDMTLQLCLRLFTTVRRSSCGQTACWILAQTSVLVNWSLYEMRTILR